MQTLSERMNMETQSEYKLTAENIGPVKRLDVKVAPGLNVLRGANGSGKSTVLEAVQYAMTGTGDRPTPRDGTGAGRLEAFGVTATFTSRANLKGSLEVESLSGRLDIGDLINPGYEDEAVNDARRIKRVLEITGVEGKPELFAHLGHDLPDSEIPDDIIQAADAVKRRLFELARSHEAAAERQKANAAAARRAADGVPVDVETDPKALTQAMVDAAGKLSALQQAKAIYDDRRKKAAEVRKSLEAAKASPAKTATQAEDEYEQAKRRSQAAVDEIQQIEASLITARAALRTARIQEGAAHDALDAARQRDEMIAGWEDTVAEAESLPAVTPEQIAEADEAMRSARGAMEAGAAARKALEQLAAADDFDTSWEHESAEASKNRADAADVDTVLAHALEQIGCPWTPIDVPRGGQTVRRLVTRHRRGEQTLVSELSDGERAKDAIDVALSLAGKSDRPAVLVLRQDVFEGLAPKVRQMIDKHAKERGVVVLTAAVSDDEEVTL